MVATIQPHERAVIKGALGPHNEIIAATIAKVYCTAMRPDRWSAQGHEGALVLLKDRSLEGGLFLRLVTFGNQQVGLLFADESEAADFAKVIYQRSEILQISSTTSKGGNRRDDRSTSSVSEGSVRSEKIRTENGSGGGGSSFSAGILGSFFRPTRKERKSKGEVRPEDIGDPTDFRHLAHIGFNPATGAFDVQNIPAEWKEIFTKAGVTQEQLENKKTAGFIADFVKNNQQSMGQGLTRTQSQQSMTINGNGKTIGGGNSPVKAKGPPPPPPAKTIRTAPPQPPARNRAASTRDISPQQQPNPASDARAYESLRNNDTLPSKGISTVEESPSIPPSRGKEAIPPSSSSPPPPRPSIDSGRAQLLESIRSANNTMLKPIARSSSNTSLGSSVTATASCTSPSIDDPSDVMASMLAKALAERNRKLAHSDSSDEDGEW